MVSVFWNNLTIEVPSKSLPYYLIPSIQNSTNLASNI